MASHRKLGALTYQVNRIAQNGRWNYTRVRSGFSLRDYDSVVDVRSNDLSGHKELKVNKSPQQQDCVFVLLPHKKMYTKIISELSVHDRFFFTD